ncbi:bifunctional acetate--CoA ligase family protein/GNAT family N-acetyltransferase [Paracandidimonas soli]|uniref:bifunctional acetate--CoA ligase family protein/GNAT family N-acetyltransferase n=1 Tax=Paracandidimonas soli TaxID=1917182 RepID=UPI0033406377
MPRHRLAALFEPQSVLVLSDIDLPAGREAGARLRGRLVQVLLEASGEVSLPEPLSLPMPGGRLDLALVCVSPTRLPQVCDAVRPLRPRCMVVLSHPDQSADPMEDAAYCRSWARLHDCALIGPRSFGVQRPSLGLNLSHDTPHALPGKVALVTQSRSIAAAVMDWADDVKLGFSAVVCLGDEASVNVAAVLDYLAMDARTDSIALYLEDIASAREFSSALRAAASVKPVVVLKSGHGRDEPGGQHDAVFDTVLRRTGAVRVPYFVQLFSALKVLGYAHRPKGRRIAVFSNGNGPAQLALDVLGPTGVLRAGLSLATRKQLQETLERGAETANPVVSFAPLRPQVMARVMQLLQEDADVDGILVLLSPDPLSDLDGVVDELARIAPRAGKPLITCFMGDSQMRRLRHVMDSAGAPSFRTPETAAGAFGTLTMHHYSQMLAQQILPPEALGRPARVDEARAIVREAQRQHRQALDPRECRQVLACFDVPVQWLPEADSPDGYGDMPPMSIRVRRDPLFGPYICFGRGGGAMSGEEAQSGMELPPLNRFLARQLVERSGLWRRELSRSMTPAAFDMLQETLECISDLVCELPTIASLALDPLYADERHLAAGGIRMELSSTSMLVLPETTGYRHLAIHPYPRHLVREKTLKDGRRWLMRPIRPEDAEPLQELMRSLSDKTRYMRFVSMLRELTPHMLSRYTRIDYDRELALVATVKEPNPANRGHPRERIVGFAHYLRNPDGRGAEYALVIGDDWQRCGMGAELMRGLIEAAQEQGLTYIDGWVLAGNSPMLGLMAYLGFSNDMDPDDPGMRRVWLDLGETRRQ